VAPRGLIARLAEPRFDLRSFGGAHAADHFNTANFFP